jgi:hypothetical protein
MEFPRPLAPEDRAESANAGRRNSAATMTSRKALVGLLVAPRDQKPLAGWQKTARLVSASFE